MVYTLQRKTRDHVKLEKILLLNMVQNPLKFQGMQSKSSKEQFNEAQSLRVYPI